MEFLKSNSNELPQTIDEAIRLLKNASIGFCDSWLERENNEAQKTSTEAFELLDHIQNELLRRRDDLKTEGKWEGSQYKLAMECFVGELVIVITQDDESNFLLQLVGCADFPSDAIPTNLTMEDALNKLKHRASDGINFNISDDLDHNLYLLTRSGMRKPTTISKIHMKTFCKVCKGVVKAYKVDEI